MPPGSDIAITEELLPKPIPQLAFMMLIAELRPYPDSDFLLAAVCPCNSAWALKLQEMLALMRNIVGTAIALDEPFMAAGLDSIGAVEVRNAVSTKYGVEMPVALIFDYPTVLALAGFVQGKMVAEQPVSLSEASWVQCRRLIWRTCRAASEQVLTICPLFSFL